MLFFNAPSPEKAMLFPNDHFPSKHSPTHQQLCFVGGRGGKSTQSQNFGEGL